MCFRQMPRADGIDLSIYSTLITVKASNDRPSKFLAIESYCVTAHRIASHILQSIPQGHGRESAS